MRTRLRMLGAALLVVACGRDALDPTAARTEDHKPSTDIADAAHGGGESHFYFLPPMVAAPAFSGVTDGAVAPSVRVCEWAGSCGVEIAAFSMTSGTGGNLVAYSNEEYHVNWKTDSCISGPCTLDPTKTYRVHILVNERELGHADVQVVNNGSQLKNVSTNEYIGLVDGRTLPVKFRVEQGIVGAISVTPGGATIRAGDTQQFAATVVDLHGNVLTDATPNWSTSAPAVAVVGSTGLVNGLAPGSATITASLGTVSGSASVVVTSGVMTPRVLLGATSMNGKIYAFGGEDQNGTTLATVEAFDPVINSWIPRASMPTSRSGVAVGVINGIAYVVGGRSGSGSNVTFDGTVEAYDPATDSWTIKAAMPTPLDRGAAAVVGGILYVIGGQTGYCGCSITNVVEAYDPVSNTWTIKTSMPTPRTGPGATTVGSIIYALGGQNTVQNVRTVEAYDPSTDTWTTKPQMPTGRGYLGVGSINGVIYAVAGSADSNPYSPLVEAFDPVAETWSSIGSITTGRLGPGLAVINATLYAVGGANGSGVLSSVNTFVP